MPMDYGLMKNCDYGTKVFLQKAYVFTTCTTDGDATERQQDYNIIIIIIILTSSVF